MQYPRSTKAFIFCILLIAILTLAPAASAINTDNWTTAILMKENPVTVYTVNSIIVKLDNNGNPSWAIGCQSTSALQGGLHYGASGGAIDPVTTYGNGLKFVLGLAFDSGNNPHIVSGCWSAYYGSMYSWHDGASWNFDNTNYSEIATPYVSFDSLRIDQSNDTAYFLYSDTDFRAVSGAAHDLYIATRSSDGTWNTDKLTGGCSISDAELELYDSTVHVAFTKSFYNASDTSQYWKKAVHMWNNGSGWNTEEFGEFRYVGFYNNNGLLGRLQMAINRTGNASFATINYNSTTSATTYNYTIPISGGWNTSIIPVGEFLISSGEWGVYNMPLQTDVMDLKIDKFNNPAFVFTNWTTGLTSAFLSLAAYNGTSWNTDKLPLETNDPSVAIGSMFFPTLSLDQVIGFKYVGFYNTWDTPESSWDMWDAMISYTDNVPEDAGYNVIYGLTYDENYYAIEGSTVQIWNSTYLDSTTSDVYGFYMFSGLAPSLIYNLNASKTSYQTHPDVAVNSSDAYSAVRQDFQLSGAHTINVMVKDMDTRNLITGNTTVYFYQNTTTYLETKLTTTGLTSFSGYPAGSYTFAAEHSDYGANVTTATIGSDDTVTIYMEKGSGQSQTTIYTPHQVRYRVIDSYSRPIPGANVTAYYIADTLPSNNINFLKKAYGVDASIAADMVNSSVAMSGITGSDGYITFSQHASLQYLMVVSSTSEGVYNLSKKIYPLDTEYHLYLTGNPYQSAITNNSLAHIYNTSLWISFPNISYVRLGLNYTDTAGSTSQLNFYVFDGGNNTLYYTRDLGVPGTGQVQAWYDLPNIRGNQYRWNFTATRT